MWPMQAEWTRLPLSWADLIRRAAGLGVSPAQSDRETYDKQFADCDVLIVGSGPAGLAGSRAR